MIRTLFTAGFAILCLAGQAQLKEGKANILKLCGCYEVTFQYAETFSPDTTYKFHEREYAKGRELVIPIETSDKRIVLQHLLVANRGYIIKHWREDWTYENTEMLRYANSNLWVKEQLKPEEVKGKWTQSVWEVSDAPRYQGVSAWVTMDGKTFWQNTADAPLPRREYKQRSDYNILKRTNRIIINGQDWQHEQDNVKIARHEGGDKPIAEEKGYNNYKKIADSGCAKAKEWWEQNQQFWSKVRNAWDSYLKENTSIKLKTAKEGESLNDKLDKLAKEYASGNVKESDAALRIRQEMDKFLLKDSNLAGAR